MPDRNHFLQLLRIRMLAQAGVVAAHADPVEYRLRHLRNERVRGVLQAVTKAVHWQSKRNDKRPPASGDEVTGRGIACVAYEGDNGYAALVADVGVNLRTGVIRPIKFTVAIDRGPISNPDGPRNQVEGGIL